MMQITTKAVSHPLAILGDPIMFEGGGLYVNKPTRPDRDLLFNLIDSVIDKNQYSNQGPLACELENKIAAYLGVKHCILVSSGTMGIQLLCEALGLRGEVILPSFTFIATAHALSWTGLTPIFCDIDPITHNICPKHCKKLITDKTTAILGVHLWGNICSVKQLEMIAEENNLALIFDSAHAFSCGNQNGLAGGLGTAEAFSFHATKSFHTGEGGAVTTNSDSLAEKLRLVRNFGFIDFNKTACKGINGKMSELHAALGLANFSIIEETLTLSKRNYELYCELLEPIVGLSILSFEGPHNFHYIVIEVDASYGLNRDALVDVLIQENIHARRHFSPGCHKMNPYKTEPKLNSLPYTDLISQKCLVLPGGANISENEVLGVVKVLVSAQIRAAEINKHLLNM